LRVSRHRRATQGVALMSRPPHPGVEYGTASRPA
jgi:hypothetical protein